MGGREREREEEKEREKERGSKNGLCSVERDRQI